MKSLLALFTIALMFALSGPLEAQQGLILGWPIQQGPVTIVISKYGPPPEIVNSIGLPASSETGYMIFLQTETASTEAFKVTVAYRTASGVLKSSVSAVVRNAMSMLYPSVIAFSIGNDSVITSVLVEEQAATGSSLFVGGN